MGYDLLPFSRHFWDFYSLSPPPPKKKHPSPLFHLPKLRKLPKNTRNHWIEADTQCSGTFTSLDMKIFILICIPSFILFSLCMLKSNIHYMIKVFKLLTIISVILSFFWYLSVLQNNFFHYRSTTVDLQIYVCHRSIQNGLRFFFFFFYLFSGFWRFFPKKSFFSPSGPTKSHPSNLQIYVSHGSITKV